MITLLITLEHLFLPTDSLKIISTFSLKKLRLTLRPGATRPCPKLAEWSALIVASSRCQLTIFLFFPSRILSWISSQKWLVTSFGIGMPWMEASTWLVGAWQPLANLSWVWVCETLGMLGVLSWPNNSFFFFFFFFWQSRQATKQWTNGYGGVILDNPLSCNLGGENESYFSHRTPTRGPESEL